MSIFCGIFEKESDVFCVVCFHEDRRVVDCSTARLGI